MPPRVLEGGDQNQGREFSPLERMFICELKMKGKKYPNIARLFSEKFGKSPPTRDGAHKMLTKLTTQGTVMTTRKGNSGPKFKDRTARNIELVRRALERASTRTPGQPGPSARRHTGNISKSSYNRITRKDLRLKPYKIMRLHKVTDQQTTARMKMGRLLAESLHTGTETFVLKMRHGLLCLGMSLTDKIQSVIHQLVRGFQVSGSLKLNRVMRR